MMDAPLGRTPAQAVDGLLNIMSAGDAKDFERAKPILDDLGENVFHVGPIGAGHTLKLINNFYAMTTACAMSEAFAMADLAGLKRETLYEVMSSGPLKSGMMDWIKAAAVDKDPAQLAFSVANGLKDVGYYANMADDFRVPSLISPAVKGALSLANASGWGGKYVPEMVDFIAEIFSKKEQ
jgi:2-hydroxy-3-oxopropionate reductase